MERTEAVIPTLTALISPEAESAGVKLDSLELAADAG